MPSPRGEGGGEGRGGRVSPTRGPRGEGRGGPVSPRGEGVQVKVSPRGEEGGEGLTVTVSPPIQAVFHQQARSIIAIRVSTLNMAEM